MEACFQELAITRAATVSYFHEVLQHYKALAAATVHEQSNDWLWPFLKAQYDGA